MKRPTAFPNEALFELPAIGSGDKASREGYCHTFWGPYFGLLEGM